MLQRSSIHTTLAALLTTAVGLAACSVNPATGTRQFSLIGEQQEIAMGRQYHEQVRQSMPLYPDQRVQEYVATLGRQLAAASERPSLNWTFLVLDDPAVNAFAIPGGHIYVTRGILAHLNSEAELVSVLGHEIGHVTGRHSVSQISKQQLLAIGVGVGAAVSESFAQFGELAQLGAGLLSLRFSRGDELEADALGLRYMNAAGYDPREMPKVFQTLGRVSEVATQGQRLPNWLSTHPQPEDRYGRIEREAAALGTPGNIVRRDEFLALVDGMTFGEDPRQGYFVDRAFYHPELKFRMDFPAGWRAVNQTHQVVAAPSENDAFVQLSLAGEKSAAQAARDFVGQEGLTAGSTRTVRVHGLEGVGAPFTAAIDGQELAGMAVFLEYGGNTYRLLGVATKRAWQSRRGAVTASLESFQRLTDARYLDVRPARVELVQLSEPMSIDRFMQRYPTSISAQAVAIMNGVDLGQPLPAGKVKRVVGGDLPR